MPPMKLLSSESIHFCQLFWQLQKHDLVKKVRKKGAWTLMMFHLERDDAPQGATRGIKVNNQSKVSGWLCGSRAIGCECVMFN